MSDDIVYYHIYSATMDPCNQDIEDRSRAYDVWLCRECKSARPGCRAVDIRLTSSRGIHKPMTHVSGRFPGIVWKEFLAPIAPAIINRDLYLGHVYGPTGKLLEPWATIHGRHRVIVRGTEQASHRICDECGQILYFAMGERYLSETPPADAEIYESQRKGLVLTEPLFRQLDVARWKRKIYVDQLPIIPLPTDEPLDPPQGEESPSRFV